MYLRMAETWKLQSDQTQNLFESILYEYKWKMYKTGKQPPAVFD